MDIAQNPCVTLNERKIREMRIISCVIELLKKSHDGYYSNKSYVVLYVDSHAVSLLVIDE